MSDFFRLEDLVVTIGSQVILDKVSLELEAGESLAIVGGSGAGKSTLVRSLLGLNGAKMATCGRLSFEGVEYSLPLSRNFALGKFAYLPQNPSAGFDPLKPLSTQWRQAQRFARNKGEVIQDPDQLLADLGLEMPGRSYPFQWSRGMQQRLLLAMVMLSGPKVIFLDEPTSALDPLISAKAMDTMAGFAKKFNVALVLVTHDLSLAAMYASKIATMTQGQIVEAGLAGELLSEPYHPYSQMLISNRHWDAEQNTSKEVSC